MASTTLSPDVSAMSAARGQLSALSPTAAISRTMLATPTNGATGRSAAAMTPEALARGGGPITGKMTGKVAGRSSQLGWAGDSIGYIYVFLRGKLDAGERRRRLVEERDGAETLLSGAIRDLGATVLREGVQHADLTGLLEAFGRAEARREGALADIAASEHQKEVEEARLAEQETRLEAEWKTADAASREADEVLRTVSAESEAVGTRLTYVREERIRAQRGAEAADDRPGGKSRMAHLKHEEQGFAAEQKALEEQTARLDKQLRDLRQKSALIRATSGTARSKLDQAIARRRQAASGMAASVASHVRERAAAEREAADLTEQLGRAAAQVRPAASSLLSAFQRIDRLQETITDRNSELAALERAAAHYDQRKLLTGVGLLTSVLAAALVAVWWAVRK
jgi:chromosome segregation ATPase